MLKINMINSLLKSVRQSLRLKKKPYTMLDRYIAKNHREETGFQMKQSHHAAYKPIWRPFDLVEKFS